ncbi:pyridoxamine 5'-phosphate oxidase family protein [Actinokineospora sp. G85]|uniref:pyridoxamine 5'-phosphate oxidase family protein n=1 Tax=Actinokineospora sp. G85 TaxID=3406626 RepID=UPI003C78BF35
MSETVKTTGRLTPVEREQFLAEPRVAVLSIPSDDDRPPSTLPTWYAYTPGGTLTVITRAGRRKSRLIRKAGVVSLSVQRPEVPYRYVTVEGTVVRQEPATEADLRRVGSRYLPADRLPDWLSWELDGRHPLGPGEVVEIRPDRWQTGDFA